MSDHDPLDVAIEALKNIKDWDETCEDTWDDPGACAREALSVIKDIINCRARQRGGKEK